MRLFGEKLDLNLNRATTMKQKLLALSAVVALILPVGLRAQDDNKPAPPPDRQQLREQLQNMSPDERQAKMRELRERGILPGGQGGQRPMPGGAGSRLGGDVERIAMVLTPEQRESMRAALEQNRDKTRDLEEKVRAARKAVLEVALEKKFDEKALRQKLDAAAKLDIDLMVIRAEALSRVEPPLSVEQIQKIKNPPSGNPRGDLRPNGAGVAPPEIRPRPPGDGPRDANDLPMPAKP